MKPTSKAIEAAILIQELAGRELYEDPDYALVCVGCLWGDYPHEGWMHQYGDPAEFIHTPQCLVVRARGLLA